MFHEIHQRLKFNRQIYMMNANVFRHIQAGRREIKNAFNAKLHQPVCNRLCGLSRYRQNGDGDIIRHMLFKSIQIIDGNTADLGSDFSSLMSNAMAILYYYFDKIVMEKGCPQIPHANERYVRHFILIKRLSEKGQQIIDIVAVSFFPSAPKYEKSLRMVAESTLTASLSSAEDTRCFPDA